MYASYTCTLVTDYGDVRSVSVPALVRLLFWHLTANLHSVVYPVKNLGHYSPHTQALLMFHSDIVVMCYTTEIVRCGQ